MLLSFGWKPTSNQGPSARESSSRVMSSMLSLDVLYILGAYSDCRKPYIHQLVVHQWQDTV